MAAALHRSLVSGNRCRAQEKLLSLVSHSCVPSGAPRNSGLTHPTTHGRNGTYRSAVAPLKTANIGGPECSRQRHRTGKGWDARLSFSSAWSPRQSATAAQVRRISSPRDCFGRRTRWGPSSGRSSAWRSDSVTDPGPSQMGTVVRTLRRSCGDRRRRSRGVSDQDRHLRRLRIGASDRHHGVEPSAQRSSCETAAWLTIRSEAVPARDRYRVSPNSTHLEGCFTVACR